MTAPTPPANIYTKVQAVAMRYGVPTSIWEDVAYTESGYNPTAMHLESTGYYSVGLFQLEQGVGQGAGHTTQELQDVTTNATIAMPAIARAWNNGKANFQSNNLSWWEKFGADSGHPGGPAGSNVNASEARILMSNYPGGNTAIPLTTTSPQGDCCQGDFNCEICMNVNAGIGNPGTICCPAVQNAVSNSLMDQIKSLFQGAFIKGSLIAVALILVVAAFVILRG